MTDTKLLVGSLSNDLFRVASLWQRGSETAAVRFLTEANNWAGPLAESSEKPYITKIARLVLNLKPEDLSLKLAEDILMYSVLLQNYALHMKSK